MGKPRASPARMGPRDLTFGPISAIFLFCFSFLIRISGLFLKFLFSFSDPQNKQLLPLAGRPCHEEAVPRWVARLRPTPFANRFVFKLPLYELSIIIRLAIGGNIRLKTNYGTSLSAGSLFTNRIRAFPLDQ